LYRGRWDEAETLSTIVIENTSTYELVKNINSVFLPSSREAIWQLQLPASLSKNWTTHEGNFFNILNATDITYNVLTDTLYNSFEITDLRRKNWIGRYYTGTDTVYFPQKYKLKYGSVQAQENSNVIRLAELYLIRAEARARLDKLSLAIDDLDGIRERAGLTLIKVTNPGISKEDFVKAIEKERQLELFTERAHRWFDLKRTDRAGSILGSQKANWSPADELYPIPQSELSKNKNLGDQNSGY
jgi:starch-binding outer membrane protein, SusD/RagB family